MQKFLQGSFKKKIYSAIGPCVVPCFVVRIVKHTFFFFKTLSKKVLQTNQMSQRSVGLTIHCNRAVFVLEEGGRAGISSHSDPWSSAVLPSNVGLQLLFIPHLKQCLSNSWLSNFAACGVVVFRVVFLRCL